MNMSKLLKAAVAVCGLSLSLSAQSNTVPAGTQITVRTNDSIDAKNANDGRIYSAVVDQNVQDSSGRVVIPRGSNAELIVRNAGNRAVALDIESIDVNGQRYTVSTTDQTVSGSSTGKDGIGTNKRTGKYVGGGAVIGSIIGAIAGGGKGAAIGAATGAGAGAIGQTVTKGGSVRVPAESLLTFRLDQPLYVGGPDTGYSRNGRHYHRYNTNPQNR
jgi:hypothetical protein